MFFRQEELYAGDLVQIIFYDTAGFSEGCMSLPAGTVLLSSLFPSCLCSIPSGYYLQDSTHTERNSIACSLESFPRTYLCMLELLNPNLLGEIRL